MVFLAVVVLTACSEKSEEAATPGTTSAAISPSTTSVADTTGYAGSSLVPTTFEPRVVLMIDEETGELTETEIEGVGPVTYGDVVDKGIEAGTWDEVEGLRLVLGYAVGAVPSENVPGIDEILTAEFTDVLDRVGELLESGATSDEQLDRWYDLARPSQSTISDLIAGASGPDALGEGVSVSAGFKSPLVTAVHAAMIAQGSDGCKPIDADGFSDWGTWAKCYLLLEDTVDGTTVRVLYPKSYTEDENLAELPQRTLDAMRLSAKTYSGFSTIGDTTTIFSMAEAPEGGTVAVATDGVRGDDNTYAQGCPITLFPSANKAGREFEQTVAHEFWHCTQVYSGYTELAADLTSWIVEGGAEYFSNVVYPSVDDEHRTLRAFDVNSGEKPIWKASYAAWIWWQFLANGGSPGAVADLMLTMVTAGDGGLAALEQYGPDFQRFTVWYMAGTITDASGIPIPPGTIFNKPVRRVTKDDKGSQYDFDTPQWVAARFLISYAEQLRVFQSAEASSGAPIAMVEKENRHVLGAWSATYPEIRSKCTKDAAYVLVSAGGDKDNTASVTIDEIEKATCDPCVLGTWTLDLESFEAMILNNAASGGQSLPPGTSLDITGAYYLSLDDEGGLQQQRDGLTMSMSSGGNSIEFVINSFSVGMYNADGEVMTIENITDLFTEVTASIPGLGDQTFVQAPAFDDGASGAYSCDADFMTVTMDGPTPQLWERIDKILKPPPIDLP